MAAAPVTAGRGFTYIAPAGTTSTLWYSETLPSGTGIRLTRPLRGAQTIQFDCGAGDHVKMRATGIVGLRDFLTSKRFSERPDAPVPEGNGVVLILAVTDVPATVAAAVAVRNPKGGLDLTAEIPKRTDRPFRKLPRSRLMSLSTSADDEIAVALGDRDRAVILDFVRKCVAMR